jgi:ribonuclease HI
MKTLKFGHDFAQQILQGQKTSTWRLYDDKDLSVDDEIRIIDKIDPDSPETWKVIGQGKINEIVEKRLGDITQTDMDGHEPFSSKDEMLRTYKQYYGDRVTFETPVKIINFTFRDTADINPTPAMMLEEARIYTDGGSRGNPGDSAAAYAVCDAQNKVIEKAGFYIGMATNNQAEYYGFKKGLERARELGIEKITLFSDSQLVVNQMRGLYKVKNQELAPLHQEVQEVANSFEKIDFVYVPREMNRVADSEVNRILDDHERNNRKNRR